MRRKLIVFLLLIALTLTVRLINAESLSVSVQVGTTQIAFSGYTSPSSQIIIKEDNAVIGTSSSDGNGNWNKTVSVATPDTLHSYTLYSIDSSSRQSAALSYNLNVAGNTTTSVSNIVIPPTLSLTGSSLSGSGYPTATITTTSTAGDTFTSLVNSSGNWTLDLSSLTGSHSLSSTMTVGSYLSLKSTSISYTTATPTPSTTSSPTSSLTPSNSSPSPSPTLSPTPTPLQSPSPSPRPFFIKLYDQNQDGKLTRAELFDTIKSWLRKLLVCDLNQDGTCNLIDLSILLYYFER